jgi:hypothetical protein
VHPKRQQNGTAIERLCSKFEESDFFEVDCPYSTMCKKRLYRYQLINKVQESIERGCADQKNDSMVRKDGREATGTFEHCLETGLNCFKPTQTVLNCLKPTQNRSELT